MKPRISLSLGLAIGLAAAAFLVYTATLTPGVPPTDSGELALAAWLPGVAHAPGFPLWTGLGWLWSHLLPAGRVIWRLNLLSACCGALAVGLIYALALRTLRVAEGQTGDGAALRLVPAAIGATALGLGRTFWSWSTVAEVYALNTALVVAILLLVVRWMGLCEANAGHPDVARPARAARPAGMRTQSRRTQRARPAQAGSPRPPASAPVAASGARPTSTPSSFTKRNPWNFAR